MADHPSQISPQQMLMARELLGWTRERLAAASETTRFFIATYEEQGRIVEIRTRELSSNGVAAARAVMEAAGVEFTNGGEPGVKLKRQSE